jgi:DNA-directed RNA polymerase specialized sigma subunit
MDKTELKELISLVVTETITALKNENFFETKDKVQRNEKSAYAKTETLLYNYTNFKKIIAERMVEIEEIKRYGVRKDMSVQEYVQKGGMPHGLVLEEESVEAAVRKINFSIKPVVETIRLLDDSMSKLKSDPYYCILEQRYFEGRTQEYIALKLNCTQAAVSQNKSRLVRELSMWLFPSEVITEFMK